MTSQILPIKQPDLDDIILQDWAKSFLFHLEEKHNSALIDFISKHFFSEIGLAIYLKSEDNINGVLSNIPAEKFYNLVPQLLKRLDNNHIFEHHSIGQIIAKLDAKKAEELFKKNPDSIFQTGIINEIEHLSQSFQKKLLEKIDDKSSAIPKLIQFAKDQKHPALAKFLAIIIQDASEKDQSSDTLYRELRTISDGLFDNINDFLNLENFSICCHISLKELDILYDTNKMKEALSIITDHDGDYQKSTEIILKTTNLISDSYIKDIVIKLIDTLKSLELYNLEIFQLFALSFAAKECRRNIEINKISLEEIFDLLELDVEYLPCIDDIIERLQKEQDKKHIIDRLNNLLSKHKESYNANNIVNIIGKLKDPSSIPFLLEQFRHHSDYTLDNITRIIISYGNEFIAYLEQNNDFKEIDKLIPIELIASYISDIGTDKASDFLFNNFDVFYHHDNIETLSTIESIPDQRFIDLLEPMVDKSNNNLDKTYYILCKLHDIKNEIIDRIKPKVIQHYKETAESMNNLSLAFEIEKIINSKGLNLELECNICNHIGEYEVEQLLGDSNYKDLFICGEVKCANCNTISDFKITERAHRFLLSYLIALAANKNIFQNPEMKIKVGVVSIYNMKPDHPCSLERKIKSDLKNHPKNTLYIYQLASLYKATNRFSPAIDLYTKLLEIEPNRVEVYFRIADILDELEKHEQAFQWLEKGRIHLTSLGTYKLYLVESISTITKEYSNLYNRLARILDKTVPSLHPTALKPKKLGRNEPCYCNSGKKYKKCHGNFV